MPTLLLTGANRGIGLGLARAYAGDGWRVIATCRDPAAARELSDLAAASAGRVTVHALDVTDGAAVTALARQRKGEAIDVLLNNAGVGESGYAFGKTDYTAWAHTLDANAMGPQRMAEAFADSVARSAKRTIVGITSLMGSMADNGSGGYVAYRSSKAALNMVIVTLAVDLAPRGITAIAIHPGWVKTDMGGPGAKLSVAQSVANMRKIIDRATLAESGKFFNHSGEELPW